MGTRWICRWHHWIDPTPVFPGVWKRRDGGFVVRARVRDPRTGKRMDVVRALPDAPSAKVALAWLEGEKLRVLAGKTETAKSRPYFYKFAASLMDRKITSGDIRSASGREKWANCLEHLCKAEWSRFFIDKITHAVLAPWRDALPTLTYEHRRKVKTKDEFGRNRFTEVIELRHYSPSALNGWLRVLKTVSKAMTIEYELSRDPAAGLRLFPEDAGFTPDDPNSLSPEDNEIGEFLALMKMMYPQHYAITFLGFAIGHRPSTLRPIRRKGATSDLFFNEDGTARLIVRRSNSRGQEVMESTKTRAVIVVDLPKEASDVLKDHIAELAKDPVTRTSDLLFPSRVTGELQSRSALQKPFNNVAKALGLKKRITPKAMRRSFKDIARAAGVEAVVRKAVSGHATDRMEAHYSTALPREKKAAVAAVINIATARAKKSSEG